MAWGRLRGQTVLPAVVALMAIILFAQVAVYSIQLQGLQAQLRIAEEKLIAERQLQTQFKLVDYEWIPVDEYRARLRVTLQNVGRFGAKIVYLAVALEDNSRYPPLWLWSQEWKAPGALGDIPQELRVEAPEWSSDGYPVVKPGGYITIETTEPIILPMLYHNPNTTIAVYVATIHGTQVLRILGKPGCIEVDAWVEGTPANILSVRIERGASQWPAELVSNDPGYLKLCGLAPGEYTVKITAQSGSTTVDRTYRVTLRDGEVKTIVIDYGRSPTPQPSKPGPSIILSFDDVSTLQGWWGYAAEGIVAYSGSVVKPWVDRDHGLGLTCNATAGACNITIHPRVVEGRYTLRIDLWVRDPCAELGCPADLTAKKALTDGSSTNHTETLLLNATLRLRIYLGGKLLFDNDLADIIPVENPELFTGATNATLLRYGGCIMAVSDALQPGQVDADADVTIICRGVNLTIDSPIVVSLWYNISRARAGAAPFNQIDTLYAFSVWRVELVPEAAKPAVWTGTLWPGDLIRVVKINATDYEVVKEAEGLISYYCFESELEPCAGEDLGLQLWGNYTLVTYEDTNLGNALKLWVEWPRAGLIFNVSCDGGCVVYAYLMGFYGRVPGAWGSDVLAQTIPYVYVDDVFRRKLWAPLTWRLMREVLPPGAHTVNITFYIESPPTAPTVPIPAWVAKLLVASNPYVTITGVPIGSQVYIYDAATGALLYHVVALNETLRIPYEELGVWRTPLTARIVVIPP
ncbi:hypothetical protein [Pyrolobus fumarii]|uniref:hypothetical protein n=1 Tax=Pyrolobus fumarii TaxID=54252 RepID=UPI00064F2F85|nr:hypothetical protein [Pyrolobus fumarii]